MDIDLGKELNRHLMLIFCKVRIYTWIIFITWKFLYDCQLSEKAANFLNA